MQDQQLHQENEYWLPYHYVSRFSPDFRQHFSDGWGINYLSTIEYLLERICRLDCASIIDIGCGDGRLSREMAIRFPEKQVQGLDYSARAIGLAQAMNADLPSLEFISRDITNPDTVAENDVAVLMEVLEHIPPEAADDFLAGVHRHLRPGGTLLITVPHVNKPLEDKHFRHFTVGSLQEALMPSFEIVEVVPFERISVSRKVVNSLLENAMFVLNHRRTLNILYRFYKRRLFHCEGESVCQRLFVMARAK